MKRPSSHAIEVICTWLAVAAFFGLLWKFPGAAHWVLSAFGDHITAEP
jgi:hypothetical protein